ncbi:MAG: hypothetical protein NZZ41_05085, partial [Candidatus Dojkabacteria bacterium]|nr:hypothetical protein [Candidatus Dojkabacteria bacterium]
MVNVFNNVLNNTNNNLFGAQNNILPSSAQNTNSLTAAFTSNNINSVNNNNWQLSNSNNQNNSHNKKLLIFSLLVLLVFLFSILIVLLLLRRNIIDTSVFSGPGYTNLCGSGFAATFYSCPANCNTSSGTCTTGSGQYMYRFVCNGRLGECRSNEQEFGPNSTASVNDQCDRTVQIDVFRKRCRVNGGWVCGSNDLLGYMVWYTGSCSSQGPVPTPTTGRKAICGEPCNSDNDCGNSTFASNFKFICHPTLRICVNPGCPNDTHPGTLCYCRSATSKCGDRCGIWSDGFQPLCGDGISSCSWLVSAPACNAEYNATYCIPINPGNGYTLHQCTTKSDYKYLRKPDGSLATTQQDILAACATSTPTPT